VFVFGACCERCFGKGADILTGDDLLVQILSNASKSPHSSIPSNPLECFYAGKWGGGWASSNSLKHFLICLNISSKAWIFRSIVTSTPFFSRAQIPLNILLF